MAQVFVNTIETTRPRRVAPRSLALTDDRLSWRIGIWLPNCTLFLTAHLHAKERNPLYLRKLWNKDACKGSGNQQDGFLSLAPVGRDGEVREVSGVLTVIKKKPPSQ